MTTNRNIFNEFVGKYQLSKTLRFELIPQGKTLDHIKQKGIIARDQQRAESYSKMKKTIDGFHKHFIELAMSGVKLTRLEDFRDLYFASAEAKKGDDFKKKFDKVKDDLRKEITKGFSSDIAKHSFEKIDKKELITELLEKWIAEQQDTNIYFDKDFKTFTTYFGGFHENRKNMYTDKAQSTAIAYRLIHENLPKFLDNIKIFECLKEKPELYEKCAVLYKEIEGYLNIISIDEAFELDYFNSVLTQKDIDVYNLIIGGRTAGEGKKKIQGINEYINLFNQQQKDKRDRVPKLKPLYKQILSDRENTSFIPEKFSESQEVLDAINDYYLYHLKDFQPKDKDDTENVLEAIQQLLAELKSYDLSKVYLRNDTKLTSISQKIFGQYGVFSTALEHRYTTVINPNFETDYAKASDKKKETLTKTKEKFTKQDYMPIAVLQQSVDGYVLTLDESHEVRKRYAPNCVADYFRTHFKAENKTDNDKEFSLTANIEAKYTCIKGLLNTTYPEGKKLYQQQIDIDNIKMFLDSLMELLHFVKPLMLPKDNLVEKDNNFYGQLETWYEQLDMLVPLYNKVRNYATQKAYSVEKFKINFDNAQLLSGWDVNKEADYLTILLRKDGHYYLAVMDRKHNKAFKDLASHWDGECYDKMYYKLLPGANKMLPKVFFSKKNIDFFNPSAELLEKYKQETHKKGDNFSLPDCHQLIDFFKDSINKHEDWKNFHFAFSDTRTYNDLSDFYKEVSHQGYKVSFERISKDYIHQLADEGKLYLFKIHNKDYSEHSKGRPNLHTLYWKALFDPENLKDVVYKLNGEAELFYRKASIEKDKMVVHKAHEAIENKNPKNTKGSSTFAYDLIKDRRYTVDKFQLHVPITANFKATGSEFINQGVLQYLRSNPDVNIIGIDRGERHLIYLTLINQKGEILRQMSLNDIVNTYRNGAGEEVKVETPYRELLSMKEEKRARARENWGAIESIKELKEGYISQVVHIIARMMVEHNAIVVMEDLNFGFKRGRFKVEKQVYQKLEKMLIDKLNYLVFKDKAPHEPGGLYKALQLTNKFKSFKDMGKQSGFIFYVPAWNTSKIDPTTGFVNLFDTRYESIDKAREFFKKFKSIAYNPSKGYFEFAFDYADFTTKADGTKTKWTVCTHGERIHTFRNPDKVNQWDNKTVNLTQEIEALLGKYNITYSSGSSIVTQITTQTDKDFFDSLLHWFKLTLQMRNSITDSEVDYLVSPVMNDKGEFYDSRNADHRLPKDADANGAYHIARKGLMWLEQVQHFEGADWKKLELDKTNKGWLQFVQGK